LDTDEFKQNIKNQLVSYLGIQGDSINVVKVSAGSIIIEADIDPEGSDENMEKWALFREKLSSGSVVFTWMGIEASDDIIIGKKANVTAFKYDYIFGLSTTTEYTTVKAIADGGLSTRELIIAIVVPIACFVLIVIAVAAMCWPSSGSQKGKRSSSIEDDLIHSGTTPSDSPRSAEREMGHQNEAFTSGAVSVDMNDSRSNCSDENMPSHPPPHDLEAGIAYASYDDQSIQKPQPDSSYYD
jgi:hypothetical protein